MFDTEHYQHGQNAQIMCLPVEYEQRPVSWQGYFRDDCAV